MSSQNWIGVDLDGTIATKYWPHDGRYNPTRIGEPIAPMLERIKAYLAEGWTVKVFTARVGPRHDSFDPRIDEVQEAIGDWTEEHIGTRLEATATKDHRMELLIDDKAHGCFEGTGMLHGEAIEHYRTALKAVQAHTQGTPRVYYAADAGLNFPHAIKALPAPIMAKAADEEPNPPASWPSGRGAA